MRRALIGHTGFVGSILAHDSTFTDYFNSKNIGDIKGQRFDEIVCCGVSAVKWLANKDPGGDLVAIMRLLEALESAASARFTLISTIDIYGVADGGDDEAGRLEEATQPYGRHRRMVERWTAERFEDHLIVRLPGLFGKGLKKNIIFDLMTGNAVADINPRSSFQWYPLRRLAGDMTIARRHGLRSVNLFTEPLETERLVERCFPGVSLAPKPATGARYDLRTRHAELFGGRGGYIMSRDAVLDELESFVADTGQD